MKECLISKELFEEIESDFFKDKEDNDSIAYMCELSIHQGIDVYGSCVFYFEECFAHEEDGEWVEWGAYNHGEDITIDSRYASIIDKYVRTDDGLHVVTDRNENGIIKKITVTLESV